MSSRGSNTLKRKYVTISVNQKLELIRKLEAGASVARVCDEYGVKKQTVSDIRKAKDKLTAFSLKYNVDAISKSSSVGARKEEEEDLTEDTRGQRTVNNVKNYNLKSAILNLAASWKALKTTTLANAWKKLLYNVEVEYDFEGFEARDFHRILKRAGENDVTEDDIRNWLEDTEGDPGYQVLTEEEIADEILVGDSRDSEDEEDDEPLPKKPKLSVIRESTDNVTSYIELSAETDDVQHYYQYFRAFRELIIQRQHYQGKQLKLDSFFKPVRPNPAAAVEPADDIDDPPAADSGHPQSPQPSTSGGQGPVEHHSSTDSE
ncbi:Tigger transposable element-derived protein 7-like 37 [Homarus americanus]|uniref:Tigger transposable element-derived protein 7-like 37 n=1 Tax=Homarus americanus TaxID=6706 RepID=A0A8J5MNZ0_HOMAM|nr:Tigger transposable element-derived protein 7-like 37 [Homarus americanus]